MTEKIHGKTGVFVPPDSQFSYVLSITFPQPTIRIRIPKVLVKAIQKRNSTSGENDEKGIKIMKKHSAESKKSFRKKVGFVFSNLFGKNKSADSGSKGENSDGQGDGDGDQEMKNSKNIVEKPEKITGKSATEDHHSSNDGVQQMALATEERKERSKSRRTFPARNNMEQKTGKIDNGDDSSVSNTTNSSVPRGGEKGRNTVGTKGVVWLEQAENPKELPWFRSTTKCSKRRTKIVWSMKKMVGGKWEKNELCKKRILMGARCRPLNHSGIIQYDKNGILLPEISP